MASSRFLIASQTLGSSAASVTFSSIPSTYTDLCLKISARDDSTGTAQVFARIQFNSDTATNYSNLVLIGNGATAASSSTANATYSLVGYTDGSNATASTFNNQEIYIPSYTSTASKPFSNYGIAETNATGAGIDTSAHLYRSGSAISSIILTPNGSFNFVSGSSFYLYGIKNS